MPSTKEIRNRIKAVKSTAKITRAMQMVAASKMKKAQDMTLKNRPYASATLEVVSSLRNDAETSHPYLEKKDQAAEKLLILITSDKGLCGSFNTVVVRKAMEYLKNNPKTKLITIGKKGQNFFKRLGKEIIATFTDFPVHPRSYDIRPIIKTIRDLYDTGNFSEVAVCYTDFESTLKQAPNLKRLLPMILARKSDAGESTPRPFEGAQGDNLKSVIKFEPSPKKVINFLIPRILETQIFQTILESIASEQSSRMVAMKNATDAASDLVEDLNLTYNSIRQASITQELAEISAAINVARDN